MGTTRSTSTSLDPPREAIEGFCRRWRITELALVGSILGDGFGPKRDVDFLVTFAPDARWTLLDLAEMEEKMGGLLGRSVDLVGRRGGAERELDPPPGHPRHGTPPLCRVMGPSWPISCALPNAFALRGTSSTPRS